MGFEKFEGLNNQVYFRLKAENGEVILQSEGYVSHQGADNGIDSVKQNGISRDNFQVRESELGEPYFVLVAENNEIIGTSEMYSSNAACEKGIESVISNLGE